jgi:hypothetical protein
MVPNGRHFRIGARIAICSPPLHDRRSGLRDFPTVAAAPDRRPSIAATKDIRGFTRPSSFAPRFNLQLFWLLAKKGGDE